MRRVGLGIFGLVALAVVLIRGLRKRYSPIVDSFYHIQRVFLMVHDTFGLNSLCISRQQRFHDRECLQILS